jgi:hypothetical protein
VNQNWVKARAGCSLKALFQLLAEVVDSDVKSVNLLDRRDVQFSLNAETTHKLIVSRTRNLAGFPESCFVVFDLDLQSNEITAQYKTAMGQPRPLLKAKPDFTPEGECRVRIVGDPEPQKLWQLSRRALEDLFFGLGLESN